ncbi:MAG TPA: HPF/RaiA family ribosome-associated protein [Candidatus Kapabacteria bacterium]|mgnify:FL=1|nr:HPF/RaiA family ribosome-associated protein [Candidatus Kapabacteria bacterium]HPO63135.1 HPF/RaiA family ribosome-associated protein [Candidatus Kapabacteria bacterium]
MKTQIVFRHLKSNPELNDAAMEEAKNLEKYYDGITSTIIEFTNETDTEKVVEFTVQVQGTTLVSSDSSDNFQKSLAEAADKMVRQIKKWKTKTGKN